MNKKYFKSLLCITVLLAIFISSQLIYAAPNGGNLTMTDEAKAEEAYYLEKGGRTLEELDENVDWASILGIELQASPRWLCSTCEWLTFTVCAGDALSSDVYYHDTLFTKDCKVTCIKSRGARVCDQGHINEWFGYHHCWEVHTKCSKGKYDVCTIDVS